MFMINSALFYKLYDFLLMNRNADIVVKYLKFDRIQKENLEQLTVFDVGCYSGDFSKTLYERIDKKLMNRMNFFLFDPNDRHIDHYKKNFKFNYKYFNYALDDKPESVKKFYFNNYFEASGSSLKSTSFDDVKYVRSRTLISKILNFFSKKMNKKISNITEAKTTNLDHFCIKNNISKIAVLKIDTESTEIDVIRGGSQIIKNCSIICVEVQDHKEKFPKKLFEVSNLLKDHFVLKYQKRILIVSLFTNIKAYDLIFVNKHLLKN